MNESSVVGRLKVALLGTLHNHAQVFFASLGRLYRSPVASLLMGLVIGITLALPAGLHILLKNVNAVSYSWEGTLQASLFLENDVSEADGVQLAGKIRQRDAVVEATYISRDQALEEFRRLSGFGEALDVLSENPLPAVIVVRPDSSLTPVGIDSLVTELSELPGIDQAKLDQKWLERLYSVLEIIERGVLIIAALLSLAVILVVGNTIRLDIQNQANEIVVMKLVGGTDAFIRRPFLYTGIWYGLLGGFIATLLINGALLTLSGPAQRLSGLYESSFTVSGLGLAGTAALFAGGTLLGWLGSAWTVQRHLSGIEPR